MGSTHSCNDYNDDCTHTKDGDFVCNCFKNDKNVQNVEVIRLSSSKWTWSDSHDSTLNECLQNDHYNMPLEIVSLIKNHSHSDKTDNYYTEKATIAYEQQYTGMKKLLKKRLCLHWYQSQLSTSQSLSIALISPDTPNRKRIFEGFSMHLPALQKVHNDEIQRRTMIINNCAISVNLMNAMNASNDLLESTDICMVIVSENDKINTINEMMQKMMKMVGIKPKAFILGQIGERNNCGIYQLCRNYKMSCIDVSVNSDKSINDLFTLAIKYYWFCTA